MDPRWIVLWLNPEPWAIGDIDIGRNKNGRLFPSVAPNHQLKTYQEAVRDELEGVEPFPSDIKYCLTFYFWRRLDTYLDAADRKRQAHEADATNLQKGLEDALQGVLFGNDRDVHDIRSVLVAQDESTAGRIVIRGSRARGLEPHLQFFPEHVRAAALASTAPERAHSSNEWGGSDSIF